MKFSNKLSQFRFHYGLRGIFTTECIDQSDVGEAGSRKEIYVPSQIMMKIEVGGPMYLAFLDGVSNYTPVLNGVDLEPECGDTRATVRNLFKIITPARKVLRFVLNKGRTLVIFETGETYYATGLIWGTDKHKDDVKQFALQALKVRGGSDKEVKGFTRYLMSLPPDYTGEPHFPESDAKLTVFRDPEDQAAYQSDGTER